MFGNDDYPNALMGFLPVFAAGTPSAPVVSPMGLGASASGTTVTLSATPDGGYPTIEFEVTSA